MGETLRRHKLCRPGRWSKGSAEARPSASAPRTASVMRPADPLTLMERRGIRLPRTDGLSGCREARRRRRGAGGERSGRVWGVSRLPFLPAGSTPCEWAELPRGLSTVSHSGQADAQRGQGVLEARDIELSPARAPRHEIHRQLGAACDRFRGFCNAHAAELGLRNRFGAHDARCTDGADYLGGPLGRWGWLMR